MKKIGFLLSVLLITFVSVELAIAAENVNYDYLIGIGPIEEFGPVVSVARNGDTVQLMGGGRFSTKPKTISGNGTFIHRNKDGGIIGTGVWTATKLVSFRSYGSGVLQGLPENFEGGRAIVKVYLDPDERVPGFEGTLRIDCTLGNVPHAAVEGIRLAVRDVPINFNREVSGATLFIRQE